MATSSGSLHEPADQLRTETIDRHRAVVSLMEELEAIDWYDQRIDATKDEELRHILEHNRDEEKEHAVMLLEWIRRRDPEMDANLRKILFTEGDIAALDHDNENEEQSAGTKGHESLTVGSLRKGGKR